MIFAFLLFALLGFAIGYMVRQAMISQIPGVLTGKAAKEFAERFLTEHAPDDETIERNKEAIRVYLNTRKE